MKEQRKQLLEGELTEKVIGVCMEVSRELGGGFLESVYSKALMIALPEAGLRTVEQAPLKVMFRGRIIGEFYPDLLIDDRLIVELKAVKTLSSEHEAQLINYLKGTGVKVGLLVNFGRPKLEWKRMVY